MSMCFYIFLKQALSQYKENSLIIFSPFSGWGGGWEGENVSLCLQGASK